MAVPNLPGVPALLSGTVNQVITMMTQDAVDYFSGDFGPQWGIFSGGGAIVTADTVASMEYKQDWVIADFPIEQGSFESYDKVATPFDARVRFVAGGTEAARAALLSSIASIAGDTNLYDVVTPEAVYSPANIRHYDYRRASNSGLGLLIVDVWLEEIRQAGSSGTQTTSAPSGADQQNGGSVQPQAATSGTSGSAGTSPVPS